MSRVDRGSSIGDVYLTRDLSRRVLSTLFLAETKTFRTWDLKSNCYVIPLTQAYEEHMRQVERRVSDVILVPGGRLVHFLKSHMVPTGCCGSQKQVGWLGGRVGR